MEMIRNRKCTACGDDLCECIITQLAHEKERGDIYKKSFYQAQERADKAEEKIKLSAIVTAKEIDRWASLHSDAEDKADKAEKKLKQLSNLKENTELLELWDSIETGKCTRAECIQSRTMLKDMEE